MSDDTVIKVEGLGKRYRFGTIRQVYATFRDMFTDTVKKLTKVKTVLQKNENEYFWALKDVNFEVKRGEVLGVIGRNGAGKSTLLKILSRITSPTEGRVEIKGRVGSLLEVGTGFHPELTGRENIFLNGAILGMTRAEIKRKFNEIVDFAEVEKFLDTPVKRYSSGMYVRLAFAIAAHLEPEILLMDEVLAVGDAVFQRKSLGKMQDTVKRGKTVLFVSHNMSSVRKLCSQTVLLDKGRITQFGPTDQVILHYLSEMSVDLDPVVELPQAGREAKGCGKRVRLFNSKGEPSAIFLLNEPWKIVLEFEIFRSTQHAIAAVGLVTMDNIPLVTYWSEPKDIDAGQYFVEFHCDLPLKANNLQIVVGLSEYENTFYSADRVGNISISEVARNEQPFRATGAGIFLGEERPQIRAIE